MNQHIQLQAKKRETQGKKVKNLRQEGILPANIYGSNIESLAIKLPTDDFLETFNEVGETVVIHLQVKGEKEARPVLIREIQAHPVTNRILHVSFAQIDAEKETTALVPIQFVGESPAVREGTGLLLKLTNQLKVTCLPTQIPSQISVDTTNLKEVNQTITVGDLDLPQEITVEAEEEELICKIEEPRMEEIEEEAPEEEIIAEAILPEEGEEAREEREEKEEQIPPAEMVEEAPPREE